MPDSLTLDGCVEQLCSWLEAPGLPENPALREQCHAELNRLRKLWQSNPALFSVPTLRKLKNLAGRLKDTQLGVRGADVRGMQAADRQHSNAEQVLKSVFGYTTFRPGQRELIEEVMSGRDAVGIMPTGAGKSLTYQIPARMFPGSVLVISPLIALMKDQVDAASSVGLRATFLNSSLTSEERRSRLERAANGAYELVYAAPEGLEASVGYGLRGVSLSLIAVDEAHCISHWGHDFRPAYRNLAGLKQRFGRVPVLALTATATDEVTKDIIEQLGIRNPAMYRGSFFRGNLKLHGLAKPGRQNRSKSVPPVKEAITELVTARLGESGIIYCLSRKSTEALAEHLRDHGVRAGAYHAGMEPEARNQIQDAFSRDDIDVVVATIAFGMGIDKSNVRYVIHRDMPRSIEGYYQEIGRAGRDGLPSDCILFYSWSEVLAYDRFAADAPPEVSDRIRSHAREMFRFAEEPGCRHQRLVGYFGTLMPECESSCDQCSPRNLFETASLGRKGKRARTAVKAVRPESTETDALFTELKTLRRQIADEHKVPAFVVFSDATLREIAARHPVSLADLLDVPGVGPYKLEQYGGAFLELLRRAQ